MRKIKSLYYHNPDPEGFEKMVKYLLRRRYRFISVQELYSIVDAGNPVNEKLAFISLDDGWRGNLDLIPAVERYNVPICIFVSYNALNTGYFWWEPVKNEYGQEVVEQFKLLSHQDFLEGIEKVNKETVSARSSMTMDEVSRLALNPLISIQSHSLNHYIMTTLDDSELNSELSESKSKLETLIGQEVFAFSYPNGSLSEREVNACSRYYKLAFTTEQNDISVNCNHFLLPRYALTGSFFRDVLKIKGIWKIARRLLKR